MAQSHDPQKDDSTNVVDHECYERISSTIITGVEAALGDLKQIEKDASRTFVEVKLIEASGVLKFVVDIINVELARLNKRAFSEDETH